MAGTFRSRDNRAWLLRKAQRVPEKEKLKINLSYLSWKTESMAMPSVKWVSDEFGLGFIKGQSVGRPFLVSTSFQLTGS